MRSSTIVAAVMAMASSVLAQDAPTEGFAVFANPAMDSVVFAGKPYTLEWAAGTTYSGAAVLSLIGGETQGTQVPIGDLATLPDVGVNKYVWNVDCSLGKAKVYGLSITLVRPAGQPKVFQWSQRFHIDNSGCGTQSSSSVSSVSSVYSASSASSADVYPTISGPAATSSSKAVTATHSSSVPAVTHSTSKPVVTESSAAPTATLTTKPSASASATSTGAPTTPTVPTAAAPRVAAGSFALAGMAVAAVLAL